MSSLIQLTNNLEGAARTLRAYAGSDATGALLAWIEAAGALYREELVEVPPEQLVALQAQVRQLDALGQLARGAVQTNGRI